MLTPARRRGFEILDDPSVEPAVRLASMGDVARSNRWLGGLRAATGELRLVLRRLPRSEAVTLLDVGTGLADIPHEAARAARQLGVGLTTVGLDGAATVLAEARQRISFAVCASEKLVFLRAVRSCSANSPHVSALELAMSGVEVSSSPEAR